MKIPSLAPVLLVLLALAAAGCQIGPGWTTPIEIAAPAEDVAGKEIIVSGFRAATSTVSVTNTGRISRILESARVHDCSLQVAKALVAKGVRAQARSDFSPRELKPNQVLLRGAIITSPWGGSGLRNFGNVVVTVFSLGMLGTVLPSPLSFQSGARVIYRAELVDANGRILVQTGDKPTYAVFDDYWMWGHTVTKEEGPTLAMSHARDAVAQALAGHFVSSGRRPSRDEASAPAAASAAPAGPAKPAAVTSRKEQALDRARSLMESSFRSVASKEYAKALAQSAEGFELATAALPPDALTMSAFCMARADVLLKATGPGSNTSNEERMAALAAARVLHVRGYRLLRRWMPGDAVTAGAASTVRTLWGEDGVREAVR